jgi:hypothetical protein
LYWWATAGDIFRIAYLFFGLNPRDSLQIFLRRVSDGLIQPSLTRPQGLSSHNVGNISPRVSRSRRIVRIITGGAIFFLAF